MPKFQWDADKNRANRAKHGISFETASLIWDDPDYLSFRMPFMTVKKDGLLLEPLD